MKKNTNEFPVLLFVLVAIVIGTIAVMFKLHSDYELKHNVTNNDPVVQQKEVIKEETKEEPKQDTFKVLAFCASWCGPCQRDKFVLAKIEKKDNVKVWHFDYAKDKEQFEKYRVTRMPTYIVYKNNTYVETTNSIKRVVSLIE